MNFAELLVSFSAAAKGKRSTWTVTRDEGTGRVGKRMTAEVEGVKLLVLFLYKGMRPIIKSLHSNKFPSSHPPLLLTRWRSAWRRSCNFINLINTRQIYNILHEASLNFFSSFSVRRISRKQERRYAGSSGTRALIASSSLSASISLTHRMWISDFRWVTHFCTPVSDHWTQWYLVCAWVSIISNI